jgi:DDE family transposase/uncharacterized protein DUF4372
MNIGKTVFAQLMEFFPSYEFRKCVERYNGNYKVKSFTCLDQFLCMAFAQLTYRESLRDIEACLRGAGPKLYHMGIRSKVSRNTIAHTNETRDWRIYADFAQVLIKIARELYAEEDFGLELDQTVYAFDSTILDLCLSVFPWAKFRKGKAGIKLHTLLDLHGNIPVIIHITPAKIHDVNILDDLLFEAGAIYVFDRAYVDFARLYRIHQSRAFFLSRAKSNFVFKRLYSQPVDKSTGVRADQIIMVTGFYTLKDYPEKLRRVRYFDTLTKKRFVFLTNNFDLPAITIAQLYKCRWQVELFFKWIKQHLRIKAFYGTTENAVKSQIWIAISIYVLVAIVKKHLDIDRSLFTILQILSLSLFEKTPILQVLSVADYENDTPNDDNQLNLHL